MIKYIMLSYRNVNIDEMKADLYFMVHYTTEEGSSISYWSNKKEELKLARMFDTKAECEKYIQLMEFNAICYGVTIIEENNILYYR